MQSFMSDSPLGYIYSLWNLDNICVTNIGIQLEFNHISELV